MLPLSEGEGRPPAVSQGGEGVPVAFFTWLQEGQTQKSQGEHVRKLIDKRYFSSFIHLTSACGVHALVLPLLLKEYPEVRLRV